MRLRRPSYPSGLARTRYVIGCSLGSCVGSLIALQINGGSCDTSVCCCPTGTAVVTQVSASTYSLTALVAGNCTTTIGEVTVDIALSSASATEAIVVFEGDVRGSAISISIRFLTRADLFDLDRICARSADLFVRQLQLCGDVSIWRVPLRRQRAYKHIHAPSRVSATTPPVAMKMSH